MRRREFITLIGGAAFSPYVARTEQANLIKRVGVLIAFEEDFQARSRVLLEGLAQLGWTEGRNLRVDYRSVGSSDPDVVRPHAESLVRAVPDVIFATPATAVHVLQKLTQMIPIVFVQSGDPVHAGSVQSLPRPGGNITGFVTFEPSMNTKYLQLLREIAPQLTRVAVVQTQASSWRGDFRVIEAPARSFGITAISILVRNDAADMERAIGTFAREPNGGLILPPDASTTRHRELIVALAAKHHLAAIYTDRRFIDAAGLMSYGAAPLDYRQVAAYVDRLLKGEKPADLPVQAPTKYELVINLKTAKALGLEVPPTLVAIADEVIE
jgi:putative ABC transport system substrate-binding protein